MDLLDLAVVEHKRMSAEHRERLREQLDDVRVSTERTLQECKSELSRQDDETRQRRAELAEQERTRQTRHLRNVTVGLIATGLVMVVIAFFLI
jgi:hypothetical protein